jgi:hypothetical protein
MSTLHTDPTAHLNPAQLQELRAAASDPVGNLNDVTRDLSRLDDRAAQLDAKLKKAMSNFNDQITIPDSVPEEAREQVRQDAESRLSAVETSSRRDLAILTTRARSIVAQLEGAASEPSLNAVPSDILDGANRFLPLMQSQLQSAKLPDIAKRLKAAVIRDDASELLAMAMVLGPILAEREADPNDPDTFLTYDIRGTLRQITSRWRDRSVDQALDQARAAVARLDALDGLILKGYSERTGDDDPYGFLQGVR